MWNNEKYLLLEHIVKIYHEDLENELKILPKISNEHVYLNSYSVMTVKYAVHVLSKTMFIALSQYGSPDASETVQFCYMINHFFDCLNVRSTTEAVKKGITFFNLTTQFSTTQPNVDNERLTWLGNTFLNYLNEWKENIEAEAVKNGITFFNLTTQLSTTQPNGEDQRLQWLANTFLNYLNEWKENNEARTGNFTKTEKAQMLIFWKTYEGCQITFKSIPECVCLLLTEGMEFILTESFCQDPLEEYFGNQSKIVGRSENPDIFQFGYNDNTIRIQRNAQHSSGNIHGRYDGKPS